MTNKTTGQPQVLTPPAPAPQSPIRSLIIALVVLAIVAVAGIILASVLLPGNTGLILQVLGVVVPTSGALLAYLQSTNNQAKIQAIHVDVNSRLTELLAAQGDAEHAKGVIQGAEALSTRQAVDTLAVQQAAGLEAAVVAKQAAETATEAALQVVHAAERAAAVLAAVVAPPPETGP